MPKQLSNAIAAIARRRRWTSEDARVVLEAASRSGLSLLRFAAEHELDPYRLYRWRSKLGDHARPPVGFAEVAVRASGSSGDDRIELSLPTGELIRVGANFDTDALRRLLAILEERAHSC